MTKEKIVFISAGFEQIMCSAGTQSLVQNVTTMIRDNANARNRNGGDGFYAKNRIDLAGRKYRCKRALGFVCTTDRASCIAESEDKALTSAVHA